MNALSKTNGGTTVFVGLSGGVDSSVTAALLKQSGYKVVGVFIRTWQPDFIECTFREDRLDAMRVAAFLGIPFLECDAEDAYKRGVADYMVAEYKAGRTPNPDVMCNREIKFGVFAEFARARGADFVATGHYARTEGGKLFKAADPAKDQAYFLYRLTKAEVRKLAEKFGLPTATKKDSQGICMLGDLDIKQFLAHYIPSARGDVLNVSGEVIGHHDGATFLTLGERHGFTITKKTPNDERYYIVAKDAEKNTITVSNERSQRKIGETENMRAAGGSAFQIERCSWVSEIPSENKNYSAQIRYHGEFLPCEIKNIAGENAEIYFEKEILAAKGQSIVIYDGDECLGGGIIA